MVLYYPRMNKMSFSRHHTHTVALVFLLWVVTIVGNGCYSFTGGSVPPHLKTLSIATTVDNSNYSLPVYRDVITRLLVDKFRNDNSFTLVDRDGDARLSSFITAIREEPVSVKAGDIERERKITITVDVEYYDAVKKKQIFKRSFSRFESFTVADAVTGRDKALRTSITQICDDILLAVVSGW